MNILCIRRAQRFSPSSVERDAQIMQSVATLLQKAKHHVVTCAEEDVQKFINQCSWHCIVSMARSEVALTLLAQAEQCGMRILNSPTALLKADRATLAKQFIEQSIPMPTTTFVRHPDTAQIPFPYWAKRGGAGAETKSDVVFIDSAEQLHSLPYANEEYIAVAHAEGDLIKFYGVAGTAFFHYYYPTAATDGFSKFGLERINGRPAYHSFDETTLKSIAAHAAKTAGFDIYGGDAIIMKDNNILLIDFNDFPSFANCRIAATEAIFQRINNHDERTEVHL